LAIDCERNSRMKHRTPASVCMAICTAFPWQLNKSWRLWMVFLLCRV